eukprot:scaffold9366_cov118-Isochrysis_galbana.AAC.7
MHARMLRLGMPVFAHDGPALQETRGEGKVTLVQVVERSKASASARQPAEAKNGWESSDEESASGSSNVSGIARSVRSRRRVPPAAMGRSGTYSRPPSSGGAAASPSSGRDTPVSPTLAAPEVVGRQRLPQRASARVLPRRPIAGRIPEPTMSPQTMPRPSPGRDCLRDGAAEADTGVGPCCTLPVSQSEIRSQASADGAALAPAVLFSPGTAGDGNCGGDASSCWVGAEGVASGGTAAGDASNGGTGAGNGVRDAAEGATGTASAVMDVLLNTE